MVPDQPARIVALDEPVLVDAGVERRLQAPGQPAPQLVAVDRLDCRAHVDRAVPGFVGREFRQPRHVPAVVPCRAGGQRTARARRHAVLARAQHQAGRQPAQIPVERAWQRLVEIVHVEHRVAFRRGEHAKIGQMRVTAQLHHHARAGQRGEVGGHHRGGAAQERERRDTHALLPQAEQLRQAVGALGGEQGCRFRAFGAGNPGFHHRNQAVLF